MNLGEDESTSMIEFECVGKTRKTVELLTPTCGDCEEPPPTAISHTPAIFTPNSYFREQFVHLPNLQDIFFRASFALHRWKKDVFRPFAR